MVGILKQLLFRPAFEGLSLIARQRRVYQALGNNIQTGEIHALSIKAKTPQENELIHG